MDNSQAGLLPLEIPGSAGPLVDFGVGLERPPRKPEVVGVNNWRQLGFALGLVVRLATLTVAREILVQF